MAKKTEVATTSEAPLPASYGDYAGLGMESISSADISIPFINLLQPLSPEVTGENAIEGAKASDFYNTVSGEIIPGKTGFLFQPCERQHVFVEWIPRDAGGGFVAVHEDNSAEVLDARRSNGGRTYGGLKLNGNDLIETVYLYGHILEDDGLTIRGFAVIAFTASKLKPLRDASTLVVTTRVNGNKPPLFAFRFRIASKPDKNKKGQPFFNVAINPKALPLLDPSKPDEAELLATGFAFFKSVRDGVRKADLASAGAAPREPGVEDADAPF